MGGSVARGDVVPGADLDRADQRWTKTLIETLAWAFQLERIEDEPAMFGGSVDSCDRIARIAAVGARIDHSGGGKETKHPDAYVVLDAVNALPPAHKHLVLATARAGWIPDPMSDSVPKWEPLLDDRGKPVVLERYKKTKAPSCIAVRLVPHPKEILAARQTYRLWYRNMQYVLATLQRHAAKLDLITVDGIGAPEQPWLFAIVPWWGDGDLDEASRILTPYTHVEVRPATGRHR